MCFRWFTDMLNPYCIILLLWLWLFLQGYCTVSVQLCVTLQPYLEPAIWPVINTRLWDEAFARTIGNKREIRKKRCPEVNDSYFFAVLEVGKIFPQKSWETDWEGLLLCEVLGNESPSLFFVCVFALWPLLWELCTVCTYIRTKPGCSLDRINDGKYCSYCTK